VGGWGGKGGGGGGWGVGGGGDGARDRAPRPTNARRPVSRPRVARDRDAASHLLHLPLVVERVLHHRPRALAHGQDLLILLPELRRALPQPRRGRLRIFQRLRRPVHRVVHDRPGAFRLFEAVEVRRRLRGDRPTDVPKLALPGPRGADRTVVHREISRDRPRAAERFGEPEIAGGGSGTGRESMSFVYSDREREDRGRVETRRSRKRVARVGFFRAPTRPGCCLWFVSWSGGRPTRTWGGSRDVFLTDRVLSRLTDRGSLGAPSRPLPGARSPRAGRRCLRAR
jgi:hypothetical protein